MNKTTSTFVPLDAIEVRERLRDVDGDWVAFLADSMAERGQLQAIEVREKAEGRYILTAGAHRLAAARFNNWPTIEVKVVNATDLEAEIREIDENLFRRDLSALDRATHLARRQDIYQELHPETTQGQTGANIRWMRRTNLSFASEVAAKLGVTDRDIRRSILRARAIAPDVREKIAGTWIAGHGVSLDALAKLGASDQRKVIVPMLRAEDPIKSVAKAFSEVTGRKDTSPDVDSEQLAKLMDAWRRSSGKARREFLDWLASIDALPAKRAAAKREFDLEDEEAA